MTPARFQAIIDQHGETMTLARAGASVTLKGKRFTIGRVGDIAGAIAQGDIQVKIGNADIAASGTYSGPPVKGDTLNFGGKTYRIQAVATLMDAGLTYGHHLVVRG